jgi:hypothetical protein
MVGFALVVLVGRAALVDGFRDALTGADGSNRKSSGRRRS